MTRKITLIGAGSVVFSKNLMGDILQFPELSDVTLCLMDIDPARLKVAVMMAQRMIAILKVKAKVVGTTNQRAAIKGARYVICTVQVGGYKPGTVIDFEIPRKYGLLQTIGDTLGIGGIFRALRTIPVMTSIAQDIADVGAPGCLLLNYTNPMAMNCIAVAKATGIPHVGLCHSVQGTSQQLASYLGLPYEDITFRVAGINHMAFFLNFDYKGQDAYPLLFKLLEQPDFKKDLVRFEMMRRLGYFVTESSEHQSEYVPYFIHHGKKLIEQFEVPIDEYLRRCEGVIETWEKTEAQLLGTDGLMTINRRSHEYGSFIIHSQETNTPRVIYGNVPNDGLIDNLPMDACVEVPCLVDGQGIQPTHIGELPPQLAAICATNVSVQTLTVEAALTNKREHIYHAAMMDPHTAATLPLDKIWAMCDELLAEHQKVGLLGHFAPTIPGTGRSFAGTGDRVIAQASVEPGARNKDLAVEVAVSNPRAKPVEVDLDVEAAVLEGALPSAQRPVHLKLKVPAGKTLSKKVSLSHPGAPDDGFTIKLSSDAEDVLALDHVFHKRQQLAGSTSGGAPFSMKLAGVPAVEGNIAVKDGKIVLKLEVFDTRVVPGPYPWEGSGIELFFARTRNSGVTQIFLVPQTGARQVKALDRGMKSISSIKASARPHTKGEGYEVEAVIPPAAVGLQSAKGFLFDTIVGISVLGAHTGGRTSLSGAFDSNQFATRFAQVD